MPSQWADYGFPDVKFKTLEKLNSGLTRAWEERSYWSEVVFYLRYYDHMDFDGSINDHIPEFRDTLEHYARDFTAEETVYDGFQSILGYRIGPYNNYGGYPNGIPQGIIGATNEYYPGYSGTRHYFVGNLRANLYPDSVISRIPIGREDAIVGRYRNYLDEFVKDYEEEFFPDFCYSLGEDSRRYLKFIPLHKLYRKMYEYVNAHHYLYIDVFSSKMVITQGGAAALRQEILDFLGAVKAYWLFCEKDGEQFLWYRTIADTSLFARDDLLSNPGLRLLLDLSPVLQFYDPPQE